MSRWKNRCPYKVYEPISSLGRTPRWTVIDRCAFESDTPHEHWSKSCGYDADWRVEAPPEPPQEQ